MARQRTEKLKMGAGEGRRMTSFAGLAPKSQWKKKKAAPVFTDLDPILPHVDTIRLMIGQAFPTPLTALGLALACFQHARARRFCAHCQLWRWLF